MLAVAVAVAVPKVMFLKAPLRPAQTVVRVAQTRALAVVMAPVAEPEGVTALPVEAQVVAPVAE